jgi:glycosyltransferase involved in cell wall biosynthesis
MFSVQNAKPVILHITHTDIRSDSRILKELEALTTFENYKILGLGFELDEGAATNLDQRKYEVITRKLYTRKLRFLPRFLRYALNFVELSWVLFRLATQFKVAVVHCHDTLVLPAGWLIKKFSRCRLVYDAHELESDKNGQSKLLSQGTLLIEKFCWPQIDLLISVSNLILQWYQLNLGEKPKVLCLNSPVINENINSSIDDGISNSDYFHTLYDIKSESLVFIYLGILGAGRGIQIYLDAFSKADEAHIVFIGYGMFESKIREYSKIYKNIHFHKAINHDQVVKLVSSADYGLCLIENISLSDYYCLPNKLFEYCFAGLPVIGSDFPEISNVVELHNLGECCTPNLESFCDMLRLIIKTRPKYVATDIASLRWDTQARRLTEFYRINLLAN